MKAGLLEAVNIPLIIFDGDLHKCWYSPLWVSDVSTSHENVYSSVSPVKTGFILVTFQLDKVKKLYL